MKRGLKWGQGLDSRKEKESPGKRNNTSLFCIHTDQILRNKLERERAGIIFPLPNFAISISEQRGLPSSTAPPRCCFWNWRRARCLTCPPGGRAAASTARAPRTIRREGSQTPRITGWGSLRPAVGTSLLGLSCLRTWSRS